MKDLVEKLAAIVAISTFIGFAFGFICGAIWGTK